MRHAAALTHADAASAGSSMPVDKIDHHVHRVEVPGAPQLSGLLPSVAAGRRRSATLPGPCRTPLTSIFETAPDDERDVLNHSVEALSHHIVNSVQIGHDYLKARNPDIVSPCAPILLSVRHRVLPSKLALSMIIVSESSAEATRRVRTGRFTPVCSRS
jgi:hypothetical protein